MSFANFLEDFWNDRAGQIQLGLPGKITKVDKKKMRADVKPLFKLKNALDEESDFPILVDLPILFVYSNGFYIRPDYAIDDHVWIGFSTHDIENALNDETRAASDTLFSQENACIISGFMNNKTTESNFSKDGLLIGKEGSLIRVAETEILFNEGTDYAVKYEELKKAFDKFVGDFNTFIQSTYNTHKHPTAAPGAPSLPDTPGTQTSADMEQSKVEKVRL